MKRLLTIWTLVLLAVVFQSCDSAINLEEPYDKYFLKYLGTDGSQTGVDLVVDTNGDVYSFGNSDSNVGGRQLYVVKATARGEVIWEKILGDEGEEDAKDIELTRDGNVVVVANYVDISGERDFVIYRLNSVDGSPIGTPRKDGDPDNSDFINSVTPTADGLIVATYAERGGIREAFIYRYDNELLRFSTSTWTTNFSQEGYDYIPVKVYEPEPDLFYTFGYTNTVYGDDNFSDNNFFINVTRDINDLQRTMILNSSDKSTDERLISVMPIPVESGAGFILAGYISNQTSGTQDIYLVRVIQGLSGITSVDPDLSQILQAPPRIITQGISTISIAATVSVYPSESSGFLVLGSQTTSGSEDFFLTKVDNSLNPAWAAPRASFTFGGIGADTPGGIVETADGRIMLNGTMVLGEVNGQRKVALIKVSSGGRFGE